MEKLWLGLLAVGGGSALGGCARWGLSVWLNPRHAMFYWGTFAANAIGGFLVGVAVAYFTRHADLSPEWRLAVITGFLGGLTTFSSYSAEVVGLMEKGEIGWALTVAGTHLAASLLLTALGFWVYRQLAG
ncbi:MAG: fluoride efflux transporter CrcB [Betaproteobacteria bacterium]|nr:fluoride efflux transporter CrcB [Betaproteobacteria bacterium]